MKIKRHITEGCFTEVNYTLGTYYKKVEDPNGIDFDIQQFKFNEYFPKCPSDLWDKVIQLYFDICHFGNNEVRVNLYMNDMGEWIILIPEQIISQVSVSTVSNKVINIETGDESNLNEIYYDFLGTSHSHNTIKMWEFSGTDDRDELNRPGIHILVSCIDLQNKTYAITASVTKDKERFYCDPSDVIEGLIGAKPNDDIYGVYLKTNEVKLNKSVFNYIVDRRTIEAKFKVPIQNKQNSKFNWSWNTKQNKNTLSKFKNEQISNYLKQLEMVGVSNDDVLDYLLDNLHGY